MRPGALAGVLAGLTLALAGCQEDAPPQVEYRPPIVTVSRPIEREVTEYAEFTGRIEAVETVEVRPRVGGYLERIFFTDGQDVKEGDLLFLIDPRTYQAELDRARAQLAQAQATERQQRVELERVKQLSQRNAAAPIELDRAIATHEGAVANVAAAQAQVEAAKLNMEFTRVTAPISGRISRNYVDVGNLVQGGMGTATLLTTIVSHDPVYVYFDVDEQTVLQIRKAIQEGRMKSYREGEMPVFIGLMSDQGFPLRGRVDFVENQINPATGTLRVRAILPNPDQVISPGMFARVRLNLGPPHPAILVADRAIASDQGQKYVLTVNAENKVVYQRVETGRSENGLRIIKSGLDANTWVITNGLQRVRPGVVVQPEPADMLSFVPAPQSLPAGPAPATATTPTTMPTTVPASTRPDGARP